MNKNFFALAIAACVGMSLYAVSPFDPDIQRRYLGPDPIKRRAAAQQALAKYGNYPLKITTYLGSLDDVKRVAAGQEVKPAATQPKLLEAAQPVKLQEAAPLRVEETSEQVRIDVDKKAEEKAS